MKDTLTVKYLASRYQISRQTLSHRFSKYLTNPPTPQKYFQLILKEQKTHSYLSGFLLIDADYFGRNRCLVVYRDSVGENLLWRFSGGEYAHEIKQDLVFLASQGYELRGVVSDGAPGIKAAGQAFGAPHQRCLVHLQLTLRSLLTKNPKTDAGKDLLLWSRHLNQIKTGAEALVFLRWYDRLHDRYLDFLSERTYTEAGNWWYTHKYLRRSFRLIQNSRSFMFVYLDVSGMPKDTNGLEGMFSQLDTKISRHRGLTQERRESLIAWYLYLNKFKKLL